MASLAGDARVPLVGDGSTRPRSSLPDLQVSMETVKWCDLSFSVGEKHILQGISGVIEPRTLSCILGPSGAGKSTLLNLLAGRQRTSGEGLNFTGSIQIGQELVTPRQMRKAVAFVMQDDALTPTQTVRESLLFSAALKLPGMSAEERGTTVDALISGLGLTACRDTIIGSALVKGVSGGERKRTSVGVELITNPPLVLLDEPTSGLDSYAASELVQELKSLAATGRIICCTIHQPSSEVFELFDQVMCLRRGGILFQGSNTDLLVTLASARQPCPNGYNVADWLLRVAQTKGDEECARLSALCQERLEKGSSGVAALRQLVSEAGGTAEGRPSLVAALVVQPAPFSTQVKLITRREFQSVMRDKKSLGARMGMSLGQAILYALIFPGVASSSELTAANSFQKNFNVFGAITGFCIAAFFGAAQPLLLSFPLERPVFLREYSSNMYSVVAYFISKTLVEMLVTFCQVLALFMVDFWVLGFETGAFGFFKFVMSVWLMALAAASMALWVGCVVSTPSSAIQLAPAISVPQILFSGLFVQSKDLPIYLQWVQYVCALKYGINLLCLTEFGSDRLGGDMLLEQQNIKPSWTFGYVGILLGIFIVFRLLALAALKKKGTYVF